MVQDNSSIITPYIRNKVVEAVAEKVSIRVEKSEENIAGVLIPN